MRFWKQNVPIESIGEKKTHTNEEKSRENSHNTISSYAYVGVHFCFMSFFIVCTFLFYWHFSFWQWSQIMREKKNNNLETKHKKTRQQ